MTVVITAQSSSSVNAYVSGVIEDGGACTATFTKDGSNFSNSSASIANVSYTQCAPIRPDTNKLSSGTWKVTVSYKSETAEGVSTPATFEVN